MGFLFGCSHKNTSFPITLRATATNACAGSPYVVCFDCGREFPYNWDEMRIVKRSSQKADGQESKPQDFRMCDIVQLQQRPE